MTKELAVNDNTAPHQQYGDKRNQQKPQGKASPSEGEQRGSQEPIRSPAPPRRGSGDKHNQQKFSAKLSK
jgi:hypothetical protein